MQKPGSNYIKPKQTSLEPTINIIPDLRETQEEQIIFRGEFTTIHSIVSKFDSQHYILKVFDFKKPLGETLFFNESRFQILNHKNIIKILDAQNRLLIDTRGKLTRCQSLLLERAPNSSLYSQIFMKKKVLTEKLARTYFHQIIDAVSYMHDEGVAHLDIKPDNILLGEGFEAKICDFDGSYMKGDKMVLGRGTKNTRAPEQIRAKVENPFLIDIFSCGVLLFILRFGYMPFLEDQILQGHNLFKLAMKKKKDEFWRVHRQLYIKRQVIDDSFVELFHGMIEQEPYERISLKEVKANKWYNQEIYNDKELAEVMRCFLEVGQSESENEMING